MTVNMRAASILVWMGVQTWKVGWALLRAVSLIFVFVLSMSLIASCLYRTATNVAWHLTACAPLGRRVWLRPNTR
jgi:membrane-associated PAP2 superfamily phosphatase